MSEAVYKDGEKKNMMLGKNVRGGVCPDWLSGEVGRGKTRRP